MLVTIVKIEGDQLTVVKDEKVKTYSMQDNVVPFAKLGPSDISFNDESKKVSMIKMQSIEAPKKGSQPSGNFAEDLIKFEDLLSEAHKKFKGDFSIQTKLIEVDWEKKHALVKARVEIRYLITDTIKLSKEEFEEVERDAIKTFEAYGDATQDNCGTLVNKHWVRMAETRAIARALRWATNNAKTAEEETENAKKD